jgi:hypothetical protein
LNLKANSENETEVFEDRKINQLEIKISNNHGNDRNHDQRVFDPTYDAFMAATKPMKVTNDTCYERVKPLDTIIYLWKGYGIKRHK